MPFQCLCKLSISFHKHVLGNDSVLSTVHSALKKECCKAKDEGPVMIAQSE